MEISKEIKRWEILYEKASPIKYNPIISEKINSKRCGLNISRLYATQDFLPNHTKIS